MSSRRPAYVSHADHMAVTYPWIASPLVFKRGMWLGPELGTGRAVYLDPPWLKANGYIKTQDIKLVNRRGDGKTALGKCAAHSGSSMQVGLNEGTKEPAEPFVRINDRDMEGRLGEYEELRKEVMGRYVDLSAQTGLNFISQRLVDGNEINAIRLGAIALRDAKRGELSIMNSMALQVAVSKMFATKLPSDPEVLASVMSSLTAEDAQTLQTSRNKRLKARYHELLEDPEYSELLSDASPMRAALRDLFEAPSHLVDNPDLQRALHVAGIENASYIDRLSGGEYSGMFGGDIDPYDLLTDPFTVWDWNGVDKRAANLLQKFSTLWSSQQRKLGNSAAKPHILINEEEGSELSDADYAQLRAEENRKLRKVITTDWSMYQFVTDSLYVGAADSPLRYWGEIIHHGTGLWIIGGQPATNKTIDTLTGIGMSEWDAYTICSLPPYCWGAVIPGRGVTYFQHIPLPSQQEFIKSAREGAKTAVRSPADSWEIVQERRARLISQQARRQNQIDEAHLQETEEQPA